MKNFDDTAEENVVEVKAKEGKEVKDNVKDLQVGDTIRINGSEKEYVLTDYISHTNSNRNKMTEPNVIVFKAFDCELEQLVNLQIKENDEVESVKNDNDLYHIEYVLPKIVNGERILEKHNMVMLAEKKREVEERLGEKNKNLQIVRIEKLIHAKPKIKK